MSLLWQYIIAATSNSLLLFRNISFCFCEQSSMERSLLLWSMYFAFASNISLLMQAMSLCLLAFASNISDSKSNVILHLSSVGANVFYLSSFCILTQDNNVLLSCLSPLLVRQSYCFFSLNNFFLSIKDFFILLFLLFALSILNCHIISATAHPILVAIVISQKV